MKQEKIKKEADKIREELRVHRRESKRKEQEIIDRWNDIIDKCTHPNLQGHREGYCPDCGYTFG
jgi:hypothetical protein